MNIHCSQVERKTPIASYLLAAFGILTALMLTLSFSRHAELHWSDPFLPAQGIQTVETHVPAAIPVPLAPADQVQAAARPEPVGNSTSILVPQIVPAPQPSVP